MLGKPHTGDAQLLTSEVGRRNHRMLVLLNPQKHWCCLPRQSTAVEHKANQEESETQEMSRLQPASTKTFGLSMRSTRAWHI